MAAVYGTKILFNRFPEIQGNLRSQAGRAVSETAKAIAADAQGAAPVLTGALRASIQAAQAGTFAWRVTAGAPYAIYVETGSGHGPAQPFLIPAAHQEQPAMLAKLASYIASA